MSQPWMWSCGCSAGRFAGFGSSDLTRSFLHPPTVLGSGSVPSPEHCHRQHPWLPQRVQEPCEKLYGELCEELYGELYRELCGAGRAQSILQVTSSGCGQTMQPHRHCSTPHPAPAPRYAAHSSEGPLCSQGCVGVSLAMG